MFSDIKEYVLSWNNQFPIDKWWRDKHKIAFGSEEHLKHSFIDQIIEYEEEVLFAQLYKDIQKKAKDEYDPGKGDIFRNPTQEEIEREFDSIDLDNV